MNKRITLTISVFFLFINAFAQLQGASQAPNGTGRYKNQIYWINWDSNNNGYPDETINSTTGTTVSRSVDVPGGITYTITLTQKASSSTLSSYVPGKWDWDDLKAGYNWFKSGATPYNYRYYYDNTSTAVVNADKYDYSSGTGWSRAYNSITDAHNSVIGLINRDQYNSATFNLTITGVYTATGTAVSANFLKGFVFAGAESLQGNGSAAFNSNKEHYQLTNMSNSNPWRVIDTVLNKVPSGYAYYGAYSWAGYETAGYTEAANVSGGGTQVVLYNGSTSTPPAAPTTPARPPAANTNAVYFEGSGDVVWTADGATSIDVFFKGDGYTAVAVGFIYSTDLGDAPISYGTNVANIQNVSFSGGVLPTGNAVYIANNALATKNAATLVIGQVVDDESSQLYSANLQGDDNNNLADEDGLTATGAIANFTAGTAAQSITVPVINNNSSSAVLMGWIDINQNGQFEANESASATIAASAGSTTAVLSWSLPQVLSSSTYYTLRLRLYDINNINMADNAGTAYDDRAVNGFGFGETEDHRIIANIILPVKLSSFSVQPIACSTQINWVSATEENFKVYHIEKSIDGKSYTAIASINGNGNNSNYSYLDETPANSIVYYRLKMIDLDGKIDYSPIKKINNNCDGKISVRPTVTNGTTWVLGLNKGQLVQVYNMTGHLVIKQIANSTTEQINLSNTAGNLYKVLVSQNGKTVFIGSIVKQ